MKLKPNIRKVCTKCGCGEYSHYRQGPYLIDFRNGGSVRGYKLFCSTCRKHCGLSTRVLR